MSNIIKKTVNCLRNNGIKFTLSMLRFHFFGGEDPRNRPDHIERYTKLTEPSRLMDALVPYFDNVDSLPIDTVYSLYRAMLPIDCYWEATSSCKRVNLVLEQFSDGNISGSFSAACAMAAAFSQKNDAQLRIISRSSPANAKVFFNIMNTLGIEMPQHVIFYNDMDCNISGNSQFKLPISDEDIFFATSWQTAFAAGKTALTSNYLYYLSNTDLSYNNPGREKYLPILPTGAVVIVETSEQWNYLSRYYPHLLKTAICLENEGKTNTLTFLEKYTKWK